MLPDDFMTKREADEKAYIASHPDKIDLAFESPGELDGFHPSINFDDQGSLSAFEGVPDLDDPQPFQHMEVQQEPEAMIRHLPQYQVPRLRRSNQTSSNNAHTSKISYEGRHRQGLRISKQKPL